MTAIKQYARSSISNNGKLDKNGEIVPDKVLYIGVVSGKLDPINSNQILLGWAFDGNRASPRGKRFLSEIAAGRELSRRYTISLNAPEDEITRFLSGVTRPLDQQGNRQRIPKELNFAIRSIIRRMSEISHRKTAVIHATSKA